MNYKIYLFVFLTLSVWSVDAQETWRKISFDQIPAELRSQRNSLPEKFEVYKLMSPDFVQELTKNYPQDYKNFNKIIQIPSPEGTIMDFQISYAPVMEEGLSVKYPGIHAFKGTGLTNIHSRVWLSASSYGWHAAVKTNQGIAYLDPVVDDNATYFIAYYVKDDKNDPYKGVPLCGLNDGPATGPRPFMPFMRSQADEVEIRNYRLAMACTGEWGKIRGSVAKCIADMNTMVTRLTQIYEDQLAIRFILIADNDKLVNLDPATDPYTGSDMGRTILGQNTSVLTERIGASAYDVGHVLSICFDVGGVAALGSACQGNKGAGVTCFNNNNFEYAVASIMAHEVGHQFDASHTMNSCAGSQENVSSGTAYEPGSGSTIMSYGGLCGVDNIKNGNDAYFHVASLEQIFNKTTPGGNAYNCAQVVITGNRNPELTVPQGGFTIPAGTPFELTALASDPDNNALTYRWEQYDLGPQSTLGTPVGTAPLFRSFPSVSDPTRFFPSKDRIFKNQLNQKDEVLPTTSRELKFRCVVRDNHPEAIATVWDEMKFAVTANSGPFKITFPRTDAKFEVGQKIAVKWDVASTDKAPVNCKNVNIYLSLNEELRTGNSNLILLTGPTENDGSAEVIIPNNVTNKANFVIKAADNIFLSTSVLPSIITLPQAPALYMELDKERETVCLPVAPEFILSTEGLSGLQDSVYFEVVSGLPENATASFSPFRVLPGGKSTLGFDLSQVTGTQNAAIIVRAFVPGVDTLERVIYLQITGTDLSGIEGISPANGLIGGQVLPAFSWSPKVDALQYTVQLATSPDFAPSSLIFERALSNTSFTSAIILDKAKIYYWRVRSSNSCGSGDWSEVYAFSTEVLSCQSYASGDLSINISASGKPVIETSLQVITDGTVKDVNVTKVRGEHQRNGDLIVKLASPSGKEVLLWNKKCSTSKNFNIGLDDQSPDFFQCPINTSRIYRPEAPLAGFNGENTKGAWKLIIQDDVSGEGGKLQEFNLEICSNIAVAAPVLVNNDTLKIPPGDKPYIRTNLLLSNDVNNTAEQLLYTLISLPAAGVITKDNTALTVGTTFTQDDINKDKIRYVHNGSSEGEDSFVFDVRDGEGGWVPPTKFSIDINGDFPSGTQETSWSQFIQIYPNPVSGGILNVVLKDTGWKESKFEIYGANGTRLMAGTLSEMNNQVHLPVGSSGYFNLVIYSRKEITAVPFIVK